ncbi:MAG: hypothetical protein KF819_32595 [Labilithrix sp.]|nr:hypothetical protein [Labilithrix sp.]
MLEGRSVKASLLLAAFAAFAGLAWGCGSGKPPPSVPFAEVEPLYDTPREYRRHAPLPCGVGAGLIYVFTASGELYAFEPRGVSFRRIGVISCPGAPRGFAQPNSMAVDRAGTAWVNYIDGAIFAVSTVDASCKATSYAPGQHGFGQLGMAFVSTGPTLSGETLFVVSGRDRFGFEGDAASGRLGRIENGERVVPIAPFDGRLSGRLAELTGTGEGRLFGFFATRPATLAEIDPNTAAILSERLIPGIPAASAWAHAFWGGRFYLFWSRGREGTNVTRVELDGRIEHLGRNPRLIVVGAGVSTCAPTSLE